MGITYTASVHLSPEVSATVLEDLSHDDEYEILSRSPGVVQLRLRAQPARTKWPEDVEIHFDTGIHVVFHSADRQSRTRLLDRLRSTLGRLGLPATFSED